MMTRDLEQDSELTPPFGGGNVPGSSEEFVTISRAEFDALLLAKREPSPVSVQSSEPARSASPSREVDDRDKRVDELERACKAAVRERELATTLSGKPLVPGAAAQLIKLWRDEFDVFEEDGGYKVSARDGRTVVQAITEMLAAPEYSHFCATTSKGGTGSRGASQPVNSLVNPEAPKNLGDAVLRKWREESATRPDNFLKPIGLRRRR